MRSFPNSESESRYGVVHPGGSDRLASADGPTTPKPSFLSRGVTGILGCVTDSEPGNVKPPKSAERRRGDRRGGDDRRKQDSGPPNGIERRKGERRKGERRKSNDGA